MMRGFSSIAKAASLATLMIFVGCSSNDSESLTAPESGSSEVPAPDAPQTPHHRGLTNGDLLRWNEPANAVQARVEGYNVYLYDPSPESSSSYVRLNDTPVGAVRYVVPALMPGQTYWFRVAAVNNRDVEGEWTDPASFVAAGPHSSGPRGGLGEYDGDFGESDGPYQP